LSRGVFGIDIGGTQLRVALADETGRVLDRRRTATAADHAPDESVAWLVSTMRELVAKQHWNMADIAAIGVGVPGPSDPARGILISPPNLPRWHNINLGRMLNEPTGIPVHLDNDARLAAFGEFRQGAGRGCRHMVYVTVSTGIGGGIIIDGTLYRGAGGTAGEVGHTVIDVNGPECHCGSRGCLEVMASGTAIARVANERLARGEASSMGGTSPAPRRQATRWRCRCSPGPAPTSASVWVAC
jgi:glucokinase